MATIRNAGRQNLLVAEQEFTYADIVNGTLALEVALPAGAIILGGGVLVQTAFNPGTSALLDVGDSATADRYKADVNLAAAAYTAFTGVGYYNQAGRNVTLTAAVVGALPTAGKGRIIVTYAQAGVATETQY